MTMRNLLSKIICFQDFKSEGKENNSVKIDFVELDNQIR